MVVVDSVALFAAVFGAEVVPGGGLDVFASVFASGCRVCLAGRLLPFS